jgi:hypothetical protein
METIFTIISFIFSILGLKMKKIITFLKIFLSLELTYLFLKIINPKISNIDFSSINSFFLMMFNPQILVLLFLSFIVYEFFNWFIPLQLDRIVSLKTIPFFDQKIQNADPQIQQQGIVLIRKFYKKIFQLRIANPHSMKEELTFNVLKESLFNSFIIIVQTFISILLFKFSISLLIVGLLSMIIILVFILASPIMKYISPFIFESYKNEPDSNNKPIS